MPGVFAHIAVMAKSAVLSRLLLSFGDVIQLLRPAFREQQRTEDGSDFIQLAGDELV